MEKESNGNMCTRKNDSNRLPQRKIFSIHFHRIMLPEYYISHTNFDFGFFALDGGTVLSLEFL